MNTCLPTSTRPARSSRNGGSTTTPIDRTRASTGSHRPSLQPAPTGAKPRTDSTHKRGQIGEQVNGSGINDVAYAETLGELLLWEIQQATDATSFARKQV